jgi:hypothetical protein
LFWLVIKGFFIICCHNDLTIIVVQQEGKMGIRVPREIDDRPALQVLDKAGLKDEIVQMQKMDLKDPVQAVQAQEKLNALLPRMNKAFDDAGLSSHELTRLSFKDAQGQTIQTDLGESGGSASLNSVIDAFAKQDAAHVAPVIKHQAPAPMN